MTEKEKKLNKCSIMQDIKDLPFTDGVKILADSIYMNLLTGGLRDNHRKKAICFSLYQANLDIGPPIDSLIIGRHLKLTPSEADSSVTEFSRKLPQNSGHHSGFIETVDLIECYCRYECHDRTDNCVDDSIDLTDEAITEIKEMWVSLSEMEPLLLNKPPRPVIAGLIWKYLKENDPSVMDTNRCSSLALLFGIAVITITNMEKYLDKVQKMKNTPKPKRINYPKRDRNK